MKILKKILISFFCLFFSTTFMIACAVYSFGGDLLLTISYIIWLLVIAALPALHNYLK